MVLSPFGSVDPDRPCVLYGQDAAEVALVWSRLAQLAPQDAAVGIAVRRLVFAGGRTDGADRLLDLMIAAEALVKSVTGRSRSRSRGAELGRIMAWLADTSEELGATSAQIEAFMTDAYRARNAAIHADRPPMTTFRRLRGDTTSDLNLVADDVDEVMRLAARNLLPGGGRT